MDVISILRKKRVAFTAYRVETTADQVDTYPQVFTRVDVIHVVEGEGISADAVHRAVELSALKYCPVSAMLAAGTVAIHHRYRIVAPDGTTTEAECVVRGPNAPAEVLDELAADVAHDRQHRPPRRRPRARGRVLGRRAGLRATARSTRDDFAQVVSPDRSRSQHLVRQVPRRGAGAAAHPPRPVRRGPGGRGRRLEGLGAREVHWAKRPADADYVIMEDPEGNRFCVIDTTR